MVHLVSGSTINLPLLTGSVLARQFHLETAKQRAQQRMREGRAKPIDALAVNLFLMEEFDVNMTAPYSVFIGLSLHEVEDLRDDIKGYQVRLLAPCTCPVGTLSRPLQGQSLLSRGWCCLMFPMLQVRV